MMPDRKTMEEDRRADAALKLQFARFLEKVNAGTATAQEIELMGKVAVLLDQSRTRELQRKAADVFHAASGIATAI